VLDSELTELAGIRDVNGWRVLTISRPDQGRKVQVAETVAHRFEVIRGSILELLPWVGSVYRLIDQLRAIIEAERRFSAHTAHELRTPLAAARAKTQRLSEMAGAGNLRARRFY